MAVETVPKSIEEALERGLEGMSTGLQKSLVSPLAALAAKFAEKVEKAPEKAPEKPKTAEMGQGGALEGITRFEVWDIPVGQALVGGFVAVFASELLDGFLAKQSGTVRGLVKLGAAGAAVKWGRGLLGSTGSKAVALLLAYDGVRSLLPLDEWASKAVAPITKLTGKGLGGRAGMNVVEQAAGVVGYYDRAFGR